MRIQRCLEEAGNDYLVMLLCIPEERDPRLPVLRVVPDARLSLSIITSVRVLMTMDTTSLSPELLQTPLNKIAEFYSYVQVLKPRYSVGPLYRHVSYAADVNSHIMLCCRLQSSMCVKIRHCGALPTDCLPTSFLAVLLNRVARGDVSSRAEKFCWEVSLKSGNIKRPKKLPNPTDFCKRRQERINR